MCLLARAVLQANRCSHLKAQSTTLTDNGKPVLENKR